MFDITIIYGTNVTEMTYTLQAEHQPKTNPRGQDGLVSRWAKYINAQIACAAWYAALICAFNSVGTLPNVGNRFGHDLTHF